MRKFFMACVGIYLISGVSQAQRVVNTQSLYWVKYSAGISIGDQTTLNASIEDRRYIRNNRQHMWLYSLNFTRQLQNGWAFGGGLLRWTILMPSDPNADIEVTQGEWRPFQQISLAQSLFPKLKFSQRLMLEERIRQNVGSNVITGDPMIEDSYYVYLRFRHRLQLTYQLTNEGASIPLRLSLANEVMIHGGAEQVQNTFDQNRLSATLQLGLFDSTNLSMGYLNWYQQSSQNTNYVRRHIATLAISQQF